MKSKNTKTKANTKVAPKAKVSAAKSTEKVAEEMCSKMMGGVTELCSSSRWKSKGMLILKIVVAYLIVYQVFLHGGNAAGIMSLGAIVTFLVNWKMGHYQASSKEKKHACSEICMKSAAISLVVGAVVTWVVSMVGDLFFGEAGANLGVVIGIILSIDLAQHFAEKFVHKK